MTEWNIEAFMGPADGQCFSLREVAEGRIMVLAREQRPPERGPGAYLYRCTSHSIRSDQPRFQLIFVGYANEFRSYVEVRVQCAACSSLRDAIMPEGTEPPLQCPDCQRMLCWPSKA